LKSWWLVDRCGQASKLGVDRIAKQKRLEKEITKGPETVKRCEKM
jgi:hypothetical protein